MFDQRFLVDAEFYMGNETKTTRLYHKPSLVPINDSSFSHASGFLQKPQYISFQAQSVDDVTLWPPHGPPGGALWAVGGPEGPEASGAWAKLRPDGGTAGRVGPPRDPLAMHVPPDTYGIPEEYILPREMSFNDDNLMCVIAYTILFLVAAFGNLTVFITLFRNRQRRSRVNLFIMHLSISDLIVTFLMMPLEIGWHVTVSWNAGDTACRLLMFFRAFGFYLSSFILVAISLDRYFAIARPLSLTDADRRGRLMLVFAWLLSVVASSPQSVIFHVEDHPQFSWFAQCVTFNFFPTPTHELAYNLFNIIAVYVFPLLVIIISYSLILCVITRKTRESREQTSVYRNGPLVRRHLDEDIRRSGIGRIEKARTRTLKMTIVIVSVFIVCWTPYFVMSAWWWFDQESADQIHTKIQKGLFLFAVSNSCMNPIVYGMFSTVFRRSMKNAWTRVVTRFKRTESHPQCPRCGNRYGSRPHHYDLRVVPP